MPVALQIRDVPDEGRDAFRTDQPAARAPPHGADPVAVIREGRDHGFEVDRAVEA